MKSVAKVLNYDCFCSHNYNLLSGKRELSEVKNSATESLVYMCYSEGCNNIHMPQAIDVEPENLCEHAVLTCLKCIQKIECENCAGMLMLISAEPESIFPQWVTLSCDCGFLEISGKNKVASFHMRF